jgi:carboxyl-terminal processing protease
VTKNEQGEDRLKEADLSGHLEGSDEMKSTDKKDKEKTTEKKSTDDDFQLNEALTLLKGINIYTKNDS